MGETVAVIAAGEMGAGVGGMLRQGGARVLTSLAGRSAASAERARRAGLEPQESDAALVNGAGFILSIVPPGDALALARRLAPALAAAPVKPIYVDCNAVAPETATAIAAAVAATGAPFIDAGIIGGPPAAGVAGPTFYASGPAAPALERLSAHGLTVRVLDGPVGAASALKMSYAGITKGLTALGSAMMLAAGRGGAAAALRDELARSQPQLLSWLDRQVPKMYPKAYRWVAEMEEIARFAAADPAAAAIYRGMAQLYARLAEPAAEAERGALTEFCTGKLERPRGG